MHEMKHKKVLNCLNHQKDDMGTCINCARLSACFDLDNESTIFTLIQMNSTAVLNNKMTEYDLELSLKLT